MTDGTPRGRPSQNGGDLGLPSNDVGVPQSPYDTLLQAAQLISKTAHPEGITVVDYWDEARTHDAFGVAYGPEAERARDILFVGDNESFIRYRPREGALGLQPGRVTHTGSGIIPDENRAFATYDLVIVPADMKGHMEKVGVFRGVDQAGGQAQAAEHFVASRVELPTGKTLRLARIEGASFLFPVVDEKVEITVKEIVDEPWAVETKLKKQNGKTGSTFAKFQFEIVDGLVLPRRPMLISHTDGAEWVAQGLGGLFLRKVQSAQGEKQLPLFTKFADVTFENVAYDETQDFITHVQGDESGTGGNGQVYQNGILLETTNGVGFRFATEAKFMSLVDLAKPR